MTDPCVCGHPRERHAFGNGFCTFNKREEAASYTYCHCIAYQAPVIVEPEEDEHVRALRGDIA